MGSGFLYWVLVVCCVHQSHCRFILASDLQKSSACCVVRECIIDYITLSLIWRLLNSVKNFPLNYIRLWICLSNETEECFYQLLITELSNLSLLPSLAQQCKLQCLPHFLLFFLLLFLWRISKWVTRTIDIFALHKKRRGTFHYFAHKSFLDNVWLSKKLLRAIAIIWDGSDTLCHMPVTFVSFFPLSILFWLLPMWFAHHHWVVLFEARWYRSSLILLFSWWTTLKQSGVRSREHNRFVGLQHLTPQLNNLLKCLNTVTSLASLLLPR